MKTLYILRHAKSSWDNPDWSDFERPLNARGLKAAPLMGEAIRKNNFMPDLILCSPAERAAQTANLVKQSAKLQSEIRYEERIYEASPARLLEIVAEQSDEIESLLLVGHNPGFEGLVRALTNEIQPMPTAALAVIDLEIENWKEIFAATGKLRTLIRPKDFQK